MVTKRIVEHDGALEAEFDNPAEAMFFHPLPKKFPLHVQEGDIWEGIFGRLWETNRTDKNGRKIFIQYFIPKTLIKRGGLNG